MRKGTDILNRPIIAFDTGKQIARVLDLIFDQNTNQLLGFLVQEGGLFHAAQVVSLHHVKAIGPDVVVVPSQSAIVSVKDAPPMQTVLDNNLVLKGDRVLTTDGRYLGLVVDLYFDDQTGCIEGYEASGGIFADAYSGRSFIPAPQTVKIGEDVTFVPPETADLMQEQIGGIRGAMMTAGNQIQASTASAGQSLQEATLAAGEKLQDVTASASLTLQNAANGIGQRIDDETRNAATVLTDQLISPDEQFTYVIGKIVDREIQSLNGFVLLAKGQMVTLAHAEQAEQLGLLDQVYRATGGSLMVGINHHLQQAATQTESSLHRLANDGSAAFSGALARVGIGQARGRRSQKIVRSGDGLIIAAPGQIVTDGVIERAERYNREVALLEAVGLQPTEATRHRANDAVSEAGIKVREQAAIAQENAYTLWEDLKIQSQVLHRRIDQALHKRRIEQALGRPVNRVILNPQDQVILNVGELITHEAIRQAEQGDVLNILLSSVYMKNPAILDAEMRAPEQGMAALEREPEVVS